MNNNTEPFSKHLIFSNIAIDSSRQTRPIKVMTSDGQDLSDYFHIVNFNGLEVGINRITIVGLNMYVAIGTEPNENQSR